MKAILFACLAFMSPLLKAQSVTELIGRGNELYRQQQYDKALAAYDDALRAAPENITARFNKANTLYKQNKPDEAAKIYDELIADSRISSKQKAGSYYNKGVLLSAQQQLEASIEAYKNVLRLDPSDKNARENLQKALLELKKKEPPKQQEQNKKQEQQQQQQQQQSKMNQKEAQRQLDLLRQKEKQVQNKAQQQKSQTGGGNQKDW